MALLQLHSLPAIAERVVAAVRRSSMLHTTDNNNSMEEEKQREEEEEEEEEESCSQPKVMQCSEVPISNIHGKSSWTKLEISNTLF